MNIRPELESVPSPTESWLPAVRRIAFGYVAVHLLLILLFDLRNPEALLQGDRSIPRMAKIERFMSSESWEVLTQRFFTYGLPGDYIWQAVVLEVASVTKHERSVLVLIQVLLTALSIPLVARVAHLLSPWARAPVIAALTYGLLPSSTAFPHLLVSEAWSVPLGIAGTWLFLATTRRGGPRWWLALSGVCWTAAVLTRPNTALVFMLFVPMLFKARSGISLASKVGFLAPPFLCAALWSIGTFVFAGQIVVSAGHPTMHEENLYDRARTAVSFLDEHQRAVEHKWLMSHSAGTLSTGEFMGFVLRHPRESMRLFAFEAAKLIFKANETKVLNYLGVWEAPPNWGKDYLCDPLNLVQKHGWVSLVVLSGTVIWTAVLVVAVYGLYVSIRAGRGSPWVVLVLLWLALVAGAFTVEIQGRHRYPSDFIIVSFFAAGMASLRPPSPTKAVHR